MNNKLDENFVNSTPKTKKINQYKENKILAGEEKLLQNMIIEENNNVEVDAFIEFETSPAAQ